MGYMGQAPGLGQRSVFYFVALEGQTVFAGRDTTGLVMGYAPGTSTVVAVNGRIVPAADYVAADGSTVTFTKPLPAGTDVLVLSDAPFSPANTYTTDAADVRFTRKRNRIVNPGMRVDQERSGASVTVASQSYSYLIDGWALTNSTNGSFSCQRVNATTPYGSPNRLRATVQVTDNSSANRYAAFNTFIEGLDIADLRFGTAGAKAVSLRIGVNFPAGNWTVTLRNAGTNGYRRWLGTIAVAPAEAGADVYKTFTIPGDVLGTWDSGTALGLHLLIDIGSGAGAGSLGWANGGDIAGVVQSDMAPAGSKFELFDVGLYEGIVVPPFELDSIDNDVRKCQRYWQKTCPLGEPPFSTTDNGAITWVHPVAGALSRGVWQFPVEMRVTPSVAYWSAQRAVVGKFVNYSAGADMDGSAAVPNSKNVIFQTSGTQPGAGSIIGVQGIANARL